MLARIAVFAFSVIQTVLTIRLILPFVSLPGSIAQYEPTIRAVSNALVAPFLGIANLVGMERGAGAAIPVGAAFLDRLEGPVLVALVGWSVIEIIALAVLRGVSRSGGS